MFRREAGRQRDKCSAARPGLLPVVEDGRLVGIVSIGDVVKHRLEKLEIESEALHQYVLVA